MLVRFEEARDRAAVHALNAAAFETPASGSCAADPDDRIPAVPRAWPNLSSNTVASRRRFLPAVGATFGKESLHGQPRPPAKGTEEAQATEEADAGRAELRSGRPARSRWPPTLGAEGRARGEA